VQMWCDDVWIGMDGEKRVVSVVCVVMRLCAFCCCWECEYDANMQCDANLRCVMWV